MGDVDSIDRVHDALGSTLGAGIGTLLAVGLLASGLASTSVGCYAGSVVMDGLLGRRIPLLVRRLITLVPALAMLALGADPGWSLVASQVVLSFGIPFALVPLLLLASRRDVMGAGAKRRPTTLAAWAVAAVVIALNIALVVITISTGGAG
jgi:manganese transport protein